jgi:quercetin dioxygenase-like cupin family protein
MIVINADNVKTIVTTDETNDQIVGKGPVERKELFTAKDTGGFGALLVTFKPGARLKFHTHTYEQILYVTAGKGIVATKTEEKVVGPGTLVYIAPNEPHWHGATKDSSFAHICLQKPGMQLAE